MKHLITDTLACIKNFEEQVSELIANEDKLAQEMTACMLYKQGIIRHIVRLDEWLTTNKTDPSVTKSGYGNVPPLALQTFDGDPVK